MVRGLIALTLILSVSACGSRLNPLNFFGGEREQTIRINPRAGAEPVDNDPRGLVDEVTSLTVEPTNSGAIVRASALASTQGFWDVELREVERTETDLVYEFRAAPPSARDGVQGAQTIVAGASLTDSELQGIRTITVIGQTNRRTVSRR